MFIKGNLQKLCDYAIGKLVEQGECSVGANNACMYQDPKGNHCAVGWIIDPEFDHYEECMSSFEDVQTLIERMDCLETYDKHFIEGLIQLQLFHDASIANLRYRERFETLLRLGKYIDIYKNPNYVRWLLIGEEI